MLRRQCLLVEIIYKLLSLAGKSHLDCIPLAELHGLPPFEATSAALRYFFTPIWQEQALPYHDIYVTKIPDGLHRGRILLIIQIDLVCTATNFCALLITANVFDLRFNHSFFLHEERLTKLSTMYLVLADVLHAPPSKKHIFLHKSGS